MATGIDLKALTPFVLEKEKDSKDKTTWQIGMLPSAILMAIKEDALNDKTTFKEVLMMNVVAVALKGWDNFKVAGVELKLKTEERILFSRVLPAISQGTMDQIQIEDLLEIGNEILIINNLTERERKN